MSQISTDAAVRGGNLAEHSTNPFDGNQTNQRAIHKILGEYADCLFACLLLGHYNGCLAVVQFSIVGIFKK